MAGVSIKVDQGRAVLALGAFGLGIADKRELLSMLALGQLVSIYRTFDEQGSPAGSWKPLSENSLHWRKYTSGHKLLMNRGILRNSIRVLDQSADSAMIGTNLIYARVQNDGYDGPQSVSAYEYMRGNRSGDRFSKEQITNKAGRKQTVTRKTASGISYVKVGAFTRHIRIPARRYMVFRPEDPGRLAMETQAFVAEKIRQSGLGDGK